MSAPHILVVDDQSLNVQLLKRKLENEGMRVTTADNGPRALTIARQETPDLILLDVMMPDMDGIEVCSRLQAAEATRSIPVIFITARTGKEYMLEGLGIGAVDYLTKPVDLSEMLARVQTQLRFAAINREVVNLQRRLGDSRRAAAVGAITQGIAHNLNNLLGVVIGYLDLIKAYYDQPEQVLKNTAQVDAAVQRIVVIIKQLSNFIIQSRPPLIPLDVQTLLNDGLRRFENDYHIPTSVTVHNPLGKLPVASNPEVFEEALAKVLINAWESYDDKPGEPRPISITTELADHLDGAKAVRILVEDRGRGLDPETRDHIFEPFISTKNTVGVGMGLTAARHAMRSLGGELTLADRPGGGVQAVLLHPVGNPTLNP